MKTENITLTFEDAAIREIAAVASKVNATVENIGTLSVCWCFVASSSLTRLLACLRVFVLVGARRLHTIIERVMEDLSFHCDQYTGQEVVITEAKVRACIAPLEKKEDLKKFIL